MCRRVLGRQRVAKGQAGEVVLVILASGNVGYDASRQANAGECRVSLGTSSLSRSWGVYTSAYSRY